MKTSMRLPASLLLAGGFILHGATAYQACAQENYPSRPVRLVVPISAGAGADVVARLLAPQLSERLGKQIIVDNRTGAGGTIGTEIVAKAKPDGYTLLMALSSFTINPAIYKNLSYDNARDFTAIGQMVELPSLMVAHPSFPPKSAKELIALARSKPDSILYSSAGAGTNPHLAMELFSMMAKIHMVHVPYTGANGIIDVMAGQVSIAMSNTLQAMPAVRAGKLRALGATGARRIATAPDIPTIAESGLPGYQSVQWYGLLAPAGTGAEIIARLHKESVGVLASPELRKTLANNGAEVVASSPEEFSAYIKTETAKWAAVVKAAHLTAN